MIVWMDYNSAPFKVNLFLVVEVEDVSAAPKLQLLKNKNKTEYSPAGVKLGWLVDPIHKDIYVFRKDRDGVVRRRHHDWDDVRGDNEVLPGFVLDVWKIDQSHLAGMLSYSVLFFL